MTKIKLTRIKILFFPVSTNFLSSTFPFSPKQVVQIFFFTLFFPFSFLLFSFVLIIFFPKQRINLKPFTLNGPFCELC